MKTIAKRCYYCKRQALDYRTHRPIVEAVIRELNIGD
jgi:hypothetical protein